MTAEQEAVMAEAAADARVELREGGRTISRAAFDASLDRFRRARQAGREFADVGEMLEFAKAYIEGRTDR